MSTCNTGIVHTLYIHTEVYEAINVNNEHTVLCLPSQSGNLLLTIHVCIICAFYR